MRKRSLVGKMPMRPVYLLETRRREKPTARQKGTQRATQKVQKKATQKEIQTGKKSDHR